MEIIHEYSWVEAVNDRQLFRLWLDDYDLPTKKPVLASVEVWHGLADDERASIYGLYLDWLSCVCPHLNKEDQLFATEDSNGKRLWVIDDGSVITMLYPHEY